MNFFDQLQACHGRQELPDDGPTGDDSVAGEVTLEYYVAYLCQAYHHVKHTVPLLMATGARLPESHEWLRDAVAEYIEEEYGHQEWILNDIEACGFRQRAAACIGNRRWQPSLWLPMPTTRSSGATRVGFFGMVHVLEGTSIAAADSAAAGIQQALGLPDAAFSYLRSHGALDQSHVKFFASLMNRIDACRRAAMYCAQCSGFLSIVRRCVAQRIPRAGGLACHGGGRARSQIMQLEGKTVVLTGAAGGMGGLIAAALAGEGCAPCA